MVRKVSVKFAKVRLGPLGFAEFRDRSLRFAIMPGFAKVIRVLELEVSRKFLQVL